LSFSIAIPDAVQQGQIGRLYANFEWREIVKILGKHLSPDSYALLIDADGRILANSENLDDKNIQFTALANKLQLVTNASGQFLDEDMLAGSARSEGYLTFTGYGWEVIILETRHSAFAKIWDLWINILEYLALTLFLAVIVSFWMSAQISKPIVRLAEFTRHFMQGVETIPPQIKSSSEITELVTQFSLMINTLEQSRLDMVRVAKLAVIGEMAASMAHEVRTPLGILRSSAQMLQREAKLSEVGVEMTGFILSETQRLNELVTTLLECAKPRLPCLNPQDINRIISHTLDLVKVQAQTKSVKLLTRFNANDSIINCDRDQLTQVFLNLVMNAIQHVAEQGQIEISTQNEQERLSIWVCDNGVGITDANKTKIFDPFFTQRQDGIGLGLTVVQQIIIAHEGNISVTDNVSGGACFHITLPTK
jgi:signal transduction histidine kinase